MKAPGYFITLLLGLVSVVLSVVLIVVARSNQTLQLAVQRQQESLSSGVLGAQGQQISGSVLQDLGNAAAVSPAIRQLLAKYGYRVQPSQSPAAAALEDAQKLERAPAKATVAPVATPGAPVKPAPATEEATTP